MLKQNFENSILPFATKNESTVFFIENAILFSSCDSKNKTSSANHFTIENLYQFKDIALFIKSNMLEKTFENTLKEVSIQNISFTPLPTLGKPNLYFKSINHFSNSEFQEENIIQDFLQYTIISEDSANLELPILYNNLANPITFTYINNNIKYDYTITDTSIPITYDGSLLKRCNVSLNNIKTCLSFEILITNNLEQKFKTSVYLDIPIETSENSITEGKLIEKKTMNIPFYRYE